jgi:hypothetical protein
MLDQIRSDEHDGCHQISAQADWSPPPIPADIRHGDMPGDKVNINEGHVAKANTIFPKLLDLLLPAFEMNAYRRAVVAVCGGSGVGKSETASLLSFYLSSMGIGSYTLSGDNYPHRIPKYNDAERLRIFRHSGIRGLLKSGEYTDERVAILKELQLSGADADSARSKEYPWLAVYQREGRNGLRGYLGTEYELDFQELGGIVAQFKNGAGSIWLRRMGREDTDLWYDCVAFHNTHVLMIEWTHGNSDGFQGVDIPILLNSTPQETLEYRKSRNRDGGADSPFTTMVLEIEQNLLVSQAAKAKMIISKSGEILSRDEYRRLMAACTGDDAEARDEPEY